MTCHHRLRSVVDARCPSALSSSTPLRSSTDVCQRIRRVLRQRRSADSAGNAETAGGLRATGRPNCLEQPDRPASGKQAQRASLLPLVRTRPRELQYDGHAAARAPEQQPGRRGNLAIGQQTTGMSVAGSGGTRRQQLRHFVGGPITTTLSCSGRHFRGGPSHLALSAWQGHRFQCHFTHRMLQSRIEALPCSRKGSSIIGNQGLRCGELGATLLLYSHLPVTLTIA